MNETPSKKFSSGQIPRVHIEESHGFLNFMVMLFIFILQTKEGHGFCGGYKESKIVIK